MIARSEELHYYEIKREVYAWCHFDILGKKQVNLPTAI